MELDLTPAFVEGLRKSDWMGKSGMGLIECVNMRPRVEGCISPEQFSYTAGMRAMVNTVSGTHYQFFVARNRIFLGTSTNLYLVTFTAPDTWTAASISSLSPISTPGSSGLTVLGTPYPRWSMASFGNAVAFTNGKIVYLQIGATWYRDIQDIPDACCAWRGQYFRIVDNVIKWSSGLGDEFVDHFGYGETYETYGTHLDEALGISSQAATGTLVRSTRFADIAKTGLTAQRDVPWYGSAFACHALNNGVMVYGDNGSAFFTRNGSIMTMVQYDDSPCARSAIGTAGDTHIFIDPKGALWNVSDGMPAKVERVGGESFFAPALATAEDFSFTQDPIRKDFYIYHPIIGTFVYNQGKISQRTNPVHTLISMPSGIYGIVGDLETTFQLVTHPFDMGNSFDKRLVTVNVDAVNIPDLAVDVAVHHTDNGEYLYSVPGRANAGTWLGPLVGGSFSLTLTGTLSYSRPQSISRVLINYDKIGGNIEYGTQ